VSPAAPRTLQYCTLQVRLARRGLIPIQPLFAPPLTLLATWRQRAQEALHAPLSSLPPRCNHGYVLYRLRADVEASLGPGASLRAEHAPALRAAIAAAQGLHARATPDEAHINAYAAGCGAEWPPISAAVGGVLAQEVLKAISGSGAPVHNFFCFDTRANAGAIQAVGVNAA
jgi:ubiquitin-like 1-activating enzyme E1 A